MKKRRKAKINSLKNLYFTPTYKVVPDVYANNIFYIVKQTTNLYIRYYYSGSKANGNKWYRYRHHAKHFKSKEEALNNLNNIIQKEKI